MTGSGIRMRFRQLLAVVVFLALTSVVQVAFAAPAAQAPPPPNGTPAPTQQPQPMPSDAQGGVNTLVEPPPIQGQSQPMLFEQYGPLDYAGLTTSFGAGSINVINDEGNGEATAEATAMYLFGIVSTRIVEWSFSLNLVSQLGNTIDTFTTGLKDSLYQQYLPVIVVIAAIVAGWTVLVMRRFLGGLTGILWAGFAIAFALQLFNAPSQYLGRADQLATGATNAIVSGIAQEDPGAPPGSYEQSGGDTNYEVRLLANRLWVVSVYDPWTMIEFGTVDPRAKNGDQLGIELLRKNNGQSNSYDQDIQTAPQWIQQWADGNWGVPRAMFGLFLVVLGGILLLFTLLIALTVIVGTLTAIVLGCLTVPVWLLAPIPGFGQRLLVSWFGGIFAGLAVSTLGALYLVVVLALLGAVQQLEASVGLITVGILDVGLIVVALWLRKSFFRFGRRVARLPVTAVAGPLAAPSRDSQEGSRGGTAAAFVSVHRTNYDRQRVPTPSAARARYAGGAGTPAAAAGARTAGARGGGATTVGVAGGATAATAGAALLGLAAAKAGKGVAHVHDAARARVQDLADVTLALPAGRAPELRNGHSPNGHSPNGHPQSGGSQPPQSGGSPPPQLPGRVAQGGVRSYRGPRVDPPAGTRAAGSGAQSVKSAPHRPVGSSPKGKRRRVEAPKP